MIWASVIGGLASIVAAGVGLLIHNKVTEIHVLVNKRLDDALTEISDLKRSVAFQKTQEPEA